VHVWVWVCRSLSVSVYKNAHFLSRSLSPLQEHVARKKQKQAVLTMCERVEVAGIGIALEDATTSSDGFCVVKMITPGGPVDMSGYERSNGEVRRVQVGDCLLRVNDISCRDMPRDEIKRYVVGPVGTKVVVVFASRRYNKGITVQLERFMAPAQPCTLPRALRPRTLA
jgi:C-terminal processing protease CtpA/Prc